MPDMFMRKVCDVELLRRMGSASAVRVDVGGSVGLRGNAQTVKADTTEAMEAEATPTTPQGWTRPDPPCADPVADWARSGVVPLTGRADGPPLVPPGWAASHARELAAEFAELTGVRVSGPRLLSERAAFTGYRRRGAVSVGGACRLLPTADGWAAVSCARPDDPALLGALVSADIGSDPWPALIEWLAEHTGAELAERAALL